MHSKTSNEALSRRGFLGALGAGAMAPGVCAMGAAHARRHRPLSSFARIDSDASFPTCRRSRQPSPQLTAALMELGKPGGIMDAKDPLDRGPILLITDPALSVNNPDNPTHTAGTTFFGQFIDHDVTFDLNSRLGVPTRPEDSPNSRSPALDLDSVYGGGPMRSPELYGRRSSREPLAGIKFIVENGGLFEDLPRTPSGTAILGDPRNDEHVILAGLHAAFLLFHNNAVDYVAERNRRVSTDEIFREARRLTTWHYQWMIVHEFLPQIIGQPLVNDILARGRRFYRPPSASCRSSSRARAIASATAWCGLRIARTWPATTAAAVLRRSSSIPRRKAQLDPDDLRGGVRAPRRFIGWQTFFDFGDGNMRNNKRIDTTLSTPLFQLPRSAIAGEGGPISLPQRNLLRHITWSLPSGQAIARAMRAPVLSTRRPAGSARARR